MCGINGFNWQDRALVEQMNAVTQHRGPDGEGYYFDEQVSFGHRRLSIIDLSEKAGQPMPNEDETIWIVYNGEIYNYQPLMEELRALGHHFRSSSDTEVIIHAYEEFGLDCFKRFNGMWAFCLYDKQKGQFILSRDRFGIKPLYYYADGQRFIFSSMITAILCHDVPVNPNDRAIMEYLSFNMAHHNADTFFEDIHSLEPGYLLIYQLDAALYTLRKWYQPTARRLADKDVLRQAFIDSVRFHMVSDVPVGVALSGGVDSTAITMVLEKHEQDEVLQTYSVVVPGNPTDESRYIAAVGKMIDARQFYLTTSIKDFMNDIDDFVTAMEEPTAAGVYAEYIIFKLTHQNGGKVLLTGQGGDELFAGYIYYYAYYFYELFKGLNWGRLLREMYFYTRLNQRDRFFPHMMFFFLLLPDRLRFLVWKLFVNRWIDHDFLKVVTGETYDPRWERMDLREALHKVLYTTAIPHLLMWADKSSMRWSVESRVPFLDVNLVECAMDIPPHQLLKDGDTKWLFKQAIWDLLPEMIRKREKVGFDAPPIDDFFRTKQLSEYAGEIIYSESFKQRPYWNWKRVEKMFRDHLGGKVNAGSELWRCINLELWLRRFVEQGSSATNYG